MDDLITALLSSLQSTLGASAYTYKYGKVERPRQSDLPMLCVVPISTVREIEGTGGSKKNYYTLEVFVWLNLTSYLDVQTESIVIAHDQDSVRIMESRSPTNSVPLLTSVLGAIENFVDTNGIVDQMPSLEISYTENAQQNVETYLVPVLIRLTMTQLIPRCPTL